MAKARFAACMACRSDAQKAAGITERQYAALGLGRAKGTNHRAGYRHREDTKRKTAAANKRFWEANPDKAIERGSRAAAHYNWKGGASKLNLSIRLMTENRKWMNAVKARDNEKCVRCGSGDDLESHHRKALGELIAELQIKSRDDARRHANLIWDLNNGETLCRSCHYQEHGRRRENFGTDIPTITSASPGTISPLA